MRTKRSEWIAAGVFGAIAAACANPDFKPDLDPPNPTTTATRTATPAPTATPTPEPTPAAAEVLIGAGDIASCNNGNDEITADLLDGIPGTVFALGDNAYDLGTFDEHVACYEPSWGRHKARTRPVLGNHEYGTPNAAGHFEYWGAAAGEPGKGWYSFDLGAWHIVVLNSNCWLLDASESSACAAGTEQEAWLRADLAASEKTCTLALWHHARFSSGKNGSDSGTGPFWNALYEHGAEVIVAAHDHSYERFAPQTPAAVADPDRGIRQFVAGMGGRSHYDFPLIRANSEVREGNTYGVLKLTLGENAYEWEFVGEPGSTFTDTGSGVCH